MHFILDAACGSDMGRLRNCNEDNYFFDGKIREPDDEKFTEPIVKEFDSEVACFGVFDGLGGTHDGQIASQLAASVLKRDFVQVENSGMMSEAFFNATVIHMNERVCMEAVQLKNKMGTTFVGTVFCEDRLYLCNIGDSRAYRYRKDKLVQISKDHVDEIPPFMQKYKRIKPNLSQCIGISKEELLLVPYVMQGEVKPDDIYLICSDGITDMLSPEEISAFLTNAKDCGACVKLLISTALARGGKDNATAIVIKVKESGKEI